MATQTCPQCGSPVRPGAKFCKSCGQPLAATPVAVGPTAPAVEATVMCPSCGRQNRAASRHCVACGQNLAATPSPAYPPPVYPPPAAVAFDPSVVSTGPVQTPARPSWKRPGLWLAVAGLVLVGLICAGSLYVVYSFLFPAKEVVEKVEEVLETATTLGNTIPISSLETTLSIPTLAIPLPDATLGPIKLPGLDLEIPRLSDEDEIKIGREAAEEFEKDNQINTDPGLNERVQRIGQAIVPHQPRPNIPYTFKVVESDEVNAFALPGGFIYVTRGMIEYVESDQELAGVIGHEIAHVALRHGAQLIENLAATQAAIDAITLANPDFAKIYAEDSTQLAISAVAEIVINGWGRDNELDADEHGTLYMARAKFLPQAVLDLFQRFQAVEGDSGHDPLEQLFATHPPFKDRIARVEETIDKYNL